MTFTSHWKIISTNLNNGWSLEFGSGYSGQNLYICFGQKSNTTTPKLIVSSIILSTDNSYNRFVPNYAVDLKTGRSYQNDAYLRGIVSTMDDMVVIKEEDRSIASWISVTDRGMFCRNDKSSVLRRIRGQGTCRRACRRFEVERTRRRTWRREEERASAGKLLGEIKPRRVNVVADRQRSIGIQIDGLGAVERLRAVPVVLVDGVE